MKGAAASRFSIMDANTRFPPLNAYLKKHRTADGRIGVDESLPLGTVYRVYPDSVQMKVAKFPGQADCMYPVVRCTREGMAGDQWMPIELLDMMWN